MQNLLSAKSVNSTTKPNKKSNAVSSRRPSYYLIKLKKFYNMQRVVEKISIGISLYLSFTIYRVHIVIFGLCRNPQLILKVFIFLISGIVFNLDNQILSQQSSISSAHINENSY